MLRSFVEVYRCQSISEAARALGLTQPAVSQHVTALEAQLGRPLFLRQARGVKATAAATDLFQRIGDGLDRAERALAAAKARSAELSGTVHIAGPAEFMTQVVSPRLGALVDAGLALRLRLGGKGDLYDMLLDAEVDLAFTASQPDDARLAFAPVASERLVPVAAPSVAEGMVDTPAAAFTHSYLAYDQDAPLVRTWAQANGIAMGDAAPVVTAPDLRTVQTLTEAALGWTVLPDYLCQEALADGRLVALFPKTTLPTNTLFLVWLKSALRHPRIAFAQQTLVSIFAT